MRKLALALLLTVAPVSVAHAQGTPFTGYIEGSIGLSIFPNVETSEYIVDTGVGIFDGHAEGDYGSAVTFGGEVGLIGGPNFRFGLSYDYAAISLDSVDLIGTLDGVPFAETIEDEDLEDAGLSFDNIIHVGQANLYYDFLRGSAFTPFIGAGIGAAFIQKTDTAVAISATVGARFAVSERVYVGGKYRFMYIGETEDALGIRYSDLNVHTFSFVVGFLFR